MRILHAETVYPEDDYPKLRIEYLDDDEIDQTEYLPMVEMTPEGGEFGSTWVVKVNALTTSQHELYDALADKCAADDEARE